MPGVSTSEIIFHAHEEIKRKKRDFEPLSRCAAALKSRAVGNKKRIWALRAQELMTWNIFLEIIEILFARDVTRTALHRDCTSNLFRDKRQPVRDDMKALKDFRDHFFRLNSMEFESRRKPFPSPLINLLMFQLKCALHNRKVRKKWANRLKQTELGPPDSDKKNSRRSNWGR